MSMFDEMLKNEHYKKLFDALPDDEKAVIMASVRKFVEEFEETVLKPLGKLKTE